MMKRTFSIIQKYALVFNAFLFRVTKTILNNYFDYINIELRQLKTFFVNSFDVNNLTYHDNVITIVLSIN